MRTWKRLRGFEIIEWNESNFDINAHPFVKAAYEAKKWAYVSDYIRAWVIYHHGGIYFDTDVFVIRDLNELLKDRAFVGYERFDYPFTAVFGAEPKHPLIKRMLDYYDELEKYSFNFEDNNTVSVSKILTSKYNCKLGNKPQLLRDGIRVYPDFILCNPSLRSKTVHVFLGSWLDNSKLKARLHEFLRMRLNNRVAIFFYVIYKKIKKIFLS